ncbi:hypothetical protein DIS24_g10438 [Lasiodiplodia hormozganensis]|uniref:Uncharacterized protein n=1 Tax=Lasiodiplodia hormozganensis TaxID=869390 RepID=A0AA40CGE1_9PEZI|nr:hypothetical protein DIS24_g10438 [Lasiodiplodia hormozganensis]
MPPSGERIVSTSTGDILGSRWGRPTASSLSFPPAPRRRPAPQTTTAAAPQPQAAHERAAHNGGDIIGSRRAAAPREPIISTIDEGDIIGRRWVPTIDRPSSTPNKQQLLSSRHATPSSHSNSNSSSRSPAPSRSTTTATTDPAPAAGAGGQRQQQQQAHQQLDKLKRLIDRLSWKSHTLVFTQSVALQSGAAMAGANAESTTTYAQPTTMFKLDFFEYYALLERILVLFLGFHRVPLPSNKINGGELLPISGKGGAWGHRYHESVLEALEGAKARGGGLEALGNEEVIAVLRRAKGFRNRWKDADEQVVPAWEWQREEVEELRLVELLDVVLRALERAYRGAEASLAGEVNGGGVGDGTENGKGTWLEVGGLQHGYVDEDMEDAPWEAVGDAMEDVMDMDMDVE